MSACPVVVFLLLSFVLSVVLLQVRFEDGLMVESDLIDWGVYFGEWARRNVSAANWDRTKWNWSNAKAE